MRLQKVSVLDGHAETSTAPESRMISDALLTAATFSGMWSLPLAKNTITST
jgi:hypothetical protein